MARRKKRSSPKNTGLLSGPGARSYVLKGLVCLAVIAGGAYWYYSDEIGGLSQVGTAYGARTACSCRYLGGRELGSCGDDFPAGMALVFLGEDEDESSVTATIPLISSTTAHYREGFGCVVDGWKG